MTCKFCGQDSLMQYEGSADWEPFLWCTACGMDQEAGEALAIVATPRGWELEGEIIKLVAVQN